MRSHHIPERFLRQIWKYRRFNDTRLFTTDGQIVEIISPGQLNTDGGPDFTDASVRIGGILYRGDVEIHEDESEWMSHGHHADAAYNGVILHVVIDVPAGSRGTRTQSRRRIPVLPLKPSLTGGHQEIWNTMILGERAERNSTICCSPRGEFPPPDKLDKWFMKLAQERIELKVQRFEERLHELSMECRNVVSEPPHAYDEIPFGLNPDEIPPPSPPNPAVDYAAVHLWLQLIYEGALEALGYSKNQRPFVRLARNARLKDFEELTAGCSEGERLLNAEAMLFGVAGLLPPVKSKSDSGGREYIRLLRERWTALRPAYHREILHPAEWQFFRLRPENFPTIRIAGAARLELILLKQDFFRSVIQEIKHYAASDGKPASFLESMFIVPAEGYWAGHYIFGEVSGTTVKRLVGQQRAREIILNTLIPVCCLYARLFKDRDVRSAAHGLFGRYPATEGNSITRLMETQIGGPGYTLTTAALQQGAIQLYKYYCLEERCEGCVLGKD
jgi:hypothetical protein